MAGSRPSPAKKPQARLPTTPGTSPSKVTKAKAAREKRLSKTGSAAVLQAVENDVLDDETADIKAEGGKCLKNIRSVEDSSVRTPTKTQRRSVPSHGSSGKTTSGGKSSTVNAAQPSSSASLDIDQESIKEPPKRSSKTSKSEKETWAYTHIPPRQDERRKNGRHEGRNLVVWTRPRMSDKLALHVQYELARHKIEVPWDAIAHRLHPGSSGSAILQYLNRLRGTLTAEGHLIPPNLPKPGSRQPTDPTIRGYVRKDIDGPDAVTTRPVPFSEPMEDRKFNLPDAFDHSQLMEAPSPRKQRKANGGFKIGRGRKQAEIKQYSPDPADLDGDADYNPKGKISGGRQRRSRATGTKSYAEDRSESADELEHMAVEVNEGEAAAENDFGISQRVPMSSSEEEDEAEEEVDSSDENVDMSDASSSDDGDGEDDCDEDDSQGEGDDAGEDAEAAGDGEEQYSSDENQYADEDEDSEIEEPCNNEDSEGYAYTNNASMMESFPGTAMHMNPAPGFVNGAMLHSQMSPPYLPVDVMPSPAMYYQPSDETMTYLPQFDHNVMSSPGGLEQSFAAQGGPALFDGTYANEELDGEYEQLIHTPSGQYSQSVYIVNDGSPGTWSNGLEDTNYSPDAFE